MFFNLLFLIDTDKCATIYAVKSKKSIHFAADISDRENRHNSIASQISLDISWAPITYTGRKCFLVEYQTPFSVVWNQNIVP